MNIHPVNSDNVNNSAASVVHKSTSAIANGNDEAVCAIGRLSSHRIDGRGPTIQQAWSSASSSSSGNSTSSVTSHSNKNSHRTTKRNGWTKEEDDIVASLVSEAGTSKPNWPKIAVEVNVISHAKRTGKQCRERYLNHLRPDIKKGGWTKEEEAMIHYYHQMFGPKWSAMAQIMKNRTDNDIKNKFYSMNRTAQRKMRSATAGGTMKGEPSGSEPDTNIFAGRQRALESSTQSTTSGHDAQVGFVPPHDQPQVQPLYYGNSLFHGTSQFMNSAPSTSTKPTYPPKVGTPPTGIDPSSPGGTLGPGIHGLSFWEHNLDF